MTVKIAQANLEATILNGSEHSYAALCSLYDADATNAMQIDRTLQKLRRKKLIAFRRDGKEVIWKKVPAVQGLADANL